MITTQNFRKGLKIEYDGKPWVVVDFQHVNPGKGAAFMRAKIKNLQTKQVLEITLKSGEGVPEPDLEFREMQYLYNDGSGFVFMDNTSFEQFTLSQDDLGDNKYFIIENSSVKVTFFQSKPVDVEIDNFVNLRVSDRDRNTILKYRF